ncbi:hypothetical protein [Lentibacillus salinarum]|uniref:t-SNARE coiled-coil homology domain-containing protein n=1 Tax=Lentibacillus salinarum TaxID=446820 RepID=A0ABW3ZWP9_9BACI
MGLFINHNEHPGVFKNNETILEPHQGYYHKDNFADMIHEQKEINQTLSNAFRELKTLYHREQHNNASKWKRIGDQLQALREREREQASFEREAMEWLATLDQNNQQLQHIIEHDDTMKKDVAERVEKLSSASELIVKRLGAYEAANQDIIRQINALADMNQSITNQLTERDQWQDDMIARLENQEALMEKVHRQISEFRAILFERSSYLAEKIEDSYNLTSSYVYKLVSGSDKPMTLYMDQRKAGSDNRRE